MSRPRWTIAALAVAPVLAGCGDGLVVEDRWPTFRVVGRVTDAAGAPVRDATVWVGSYGGDCTTASALGGPFATDGRGRYTGGFPDVVGTFEGCVVVLLARPRAGASLRTASVVARAEGVRLSPAPGDSLVLDVRLASAR